LNCVSKLLKAASAGAHAKVGDITAQTAFNNNAPKRPLGVVVIDEIGDFLGRIARSKNAWERGLVAALRTQWGKSFQTFGTTTSAEHEGVDIECPAMSIFGAATREAFWEILQGAEVRNGFLSRFLALASEFRAEDTDPPLDPSEVPEALADNLVKLFLWGGTPLELAQLTNPNMRFRPHVLSWETPEARACWQDLVKWIEAEVESDISKEEYFGRLAETAIRLATIRAAGRLGPDAKVSLLDMEWGAGLARAVVTLMMERSAESFAQTARGEIAAKILAFVQRKGEVSRRDLQRFLHANYSTRDVDDILKTLTEGVQVIRRETKPARASVITYTAAAK
jgi:Protein of unknown function (DUF3987)